MKLYFISTTRAVRPRWLLEEMEIEYDYLVENRFSAADFVSGVLLWALRLGMLKVNSPVKSYITRLRERLALQKADIYAYAEID